MCGRMSLTRRGLDDLADELEATCDDAFAAAYRPRYNVAPTDPHPVLRLRGGLRQLELARWGLPSTGKSKAPLFNARAEGVRSRPAFRFAYQDSRCVVPADGFYEWNADGQPLWIHRADGKLLLLAGLWEAGAFSVLTTTPNRFVSAIHDRMPAILSPDEAAAWLQAPSLDLLHPAPEGLLQARPVSTRVNSVRNDDPDCLAPPAQPAPSQLSLFGRAL
jgi:putative SOS response-associated peptidase YedK